MTVERIVGDPAAAAASIASGGHLERHSVVMVLDLTLALPAPLVIDGFWIAPMNPDRVNEYGEVVARAYPPEHPDHEPADADQESWTLGQGRQMTLRDLWDADTARRYDDPSSPMFSPEVLSPTVDFPADLAGDGRALEFAIGTGRVAIPLAERGVRVSGIELSQPMVDQLRRKKPDTGIPTVSPSSSATWQPLASRASTRSCIWSATPSETSVRRTSRSTASATLHGTLHLGATSCSSCGSLAFAASRRARRPCRSRSARATPVWIPTT